MRDYIILNGVNSNTITGLLISTLPPITKPKIRTQTEEIDGRDGDIITKLGYSAYDKEIQIGLYGNFDINQVIAYFNTSGTVTFSNEPDKYYNYQILDQIDYDKLIRFKTAKVKMHVQPFKYPLEETPVEINIQNVTGSGETISLDNTAEAPITLALKGNTSQDGTPTPEAPVEVNTVSGDNSINVCGKNLLYNSFYQTSANGIKCELLNFPSGTFTWSFTNQNIPGEIQVKTKVNGSYQTYANAYSTNKLTFTLNTPQDIQLESYRAGGNPLSNYSNMMINKGQTALPYEPHIENTYPISLGDIELCKIGDYQDYFFKDNNKWYIKRQIGKYVYNNDLTNNSITADKVEMLTPALDIVANTRPLTNIAICNMMGSALSNYTGLDGTTSAKKIRVNMSTSYASSYNEFNTLASNNNFTIYYILGTPEDEEITDNILIGQLNALENARSYDTTTHINQNTANKPFIINATAVQKGTDTGTVDNIGNIYAKPSIDVEGSGIVEIYLDGNQMFSVDLSSSNECVIDTANLEAYNPETTQLMNRQVTGDYSNFIINTGENTVKVSGNVTKATISNYTRWL